MVNTNDELEKYKNQLEQLKRVQEAGKVGYWAVYAGNEFLEWSAETYKLFDIPFGKSITYEDMLTYVHPDDKDYVNEKWQMATKHGEYAVVYRIISAKHNIKWIETFGDVVFDTDGNFMQALGIVRDITAQKEGEIKKVALTKFLKRSQKIGKLGSWIIKASSTPFFELNEEAQIMFGWPLGKPISIDDWMSAIHADDRKHVMQSWDKAIKEGEEYDIEYRIIANNSTKWIKAVGEAEFDSNGEFVQAIGIVKDITEHIAQQENLSIAKDQAEAANKLKSEFLANMSHEIRTPLNGVIGFSELLMKTSLDETQKHYMTTLNESAHNLIYIINDILDLSKIEAGKMELAEEKVNLLELIKQVKNMFSYQNQEKKINFHIKTGSNLPRYVLTDGLRLQQVLINLVSNAIKFTKEGEIELSLQLMHTNSQTTNMFRFSVRDTGIGISTQNKNKIFEAFTQEDLSTTKQYGGAGLGLSICNGILAMMDSNLQLESEIGKGSQFYFDVSFKPIMEESSNSKVSSNINQRHGDILIDKDLKSLAIKILVVDDNDTNIFLAEVLIQNILPNSTILKAYDGKMAIELFKKDKPDFILMDVQMPIMNGYEATAKIREIENTLFLNQKSYKSIPIIGITAGIMRDEKTKCLEAGMNDFMAKPIINNIFISLIRKWILR